MDFIELDSNKLGWLLQCGFLIILMQAGFTCIESGMVRAKNSINVAIKNLVDFCIAAILFSLFGFGLMFGASQSGWFGTSHFFLADEMSKSLMAFFFFQAMFCGTATTIVSGAVAERMRFSGYIISSAIIAGIIYPLVGHWVWNGVHSGNAAGWLGVAGFIDFAGSTVVHSVAGWMALAAVILIGPRIGRFGPGGKRIEGHSLPIATLGVFLLWFGWFGFNGGSGFAPDTNIPLILSNTAIAGAAGGLVVLLMSWRMMGTPQADHIINGIIAGLVAITASVNLMTPMMAMFIGAVGGAVCLLGMSLLERLQIDDAIGAVPTHLFAGIWGTLAVALAPYGAWDNGLTRWEQFSIQLEGIVVIGLFSFCAGYLLLKLVNCWTPLRVSTEDERIGLNISEHGASSSILDLITQMDQQASSRDFSKPIDVEEETDAAHIATFYNAVLQSFGVETSRRQMAINKLAQLANYDTLTGLANRRLYFTEVKRALSRSTRYETKGAILYMDLDGFKAVNDTLGHNHGDELLKQVSQRMSSCLRETDVLARIGGDEFAILLEDLDNQSQIKAVAEKIIETVSSPVEMDEHKVMVGVSIGITPFSSTHEETVDSIIQKADHAMYAAKLAGKGTCHFYTDEDDPFAQK